MRLFFLLSVLIAVAATPALAGDASLAWGTVTSSGSSGFVESAAQNRANSETAVFTAQGRDTILPGGSYTSIGVINTIDISGDNVTLTADQNGENNGEVNSGPNIFLD
ncbi:MAG: hypothetical protein AAFP99_05875 [Pseudomonadota bacterium]